ncbi:nuclear transport factor 2 family protein [Micromonospora sp. NBC_01392]|uniref:nuclear transport factor 2 family protein n=1 Tax=Micromonospora sp. NBC_01392 TaxID=2903588 RepID=UPI00324BA25B
MTEINWSQAKAIEPGELPETITRYLTAHQARDIDTAIALYAPDATVTDEGRTHHGPEQIRAWLSRSTDEYTYTTELTAAAKLHDQHYDAVHHLAGNFPGGTADLHFRFTLRDGLIARLVIEP